MNNSISSIKACRRQKNGVFVHLALDQIAVHAVLRCPDPITVIVQLPEFIDGWCTPIIAPP
jgi:hypothetical protein